MATVRSSLEFAITAAYLGKPAMQAARDDFLKTRDELRRMAAEGVDLRVTLSGLEKDKAEIAALTAKVHDIHLRGVADTESAEIALNHTARAREAKILAVADTATARSDLDKLAIDRTMILRFKPEAAEVTAAADDLSRDRTTVVHAKAEGLAEATTEINEVAKPRVLPIVAKIEADAESQKRMSDLLAQRNSMMYTIEEQRRTSHVEIDEALRNKKRDVDDRYAGKKRTPEVSRSIFDQKSGLEAEAKNAKNSARMDELRQKNQVSQWAREQGIGERSGLNKTKAGIADDARTATVAEKLRARNQRAADSATSARAKIDKTAEDRVATIRVRAEANEAKAAIDDVTKRRSVEIDLNLKNAKDDLEKAFPGKRPMEIQAMITRAKDSLDFVARNQKLDNAGGTAAAKRGIDRAVQVRGVAVSSGANRGEADSAASGTIATIQAKAKTDVADAQLDYAARQREAVITAKADIAEAQSKLTEVAKDRTANTKTDKSGLDKISSAADKATKSVMSLAAAMATVSLGSAVLGAVLTTGLAAGVIAAGGAAIAVNKRLATSHKEAQDAAKLQAETAKRDLAQAYRDVSDSAIESAQKITAAQHEVQMADRQEEDARRSLTEAYRDARHELEDLQLQLVQAPINQRSADLAVGRAFQNLAELGKRTDVTPLDYSEALNNIDEAKAHADEVRVKNQQLQEDAKVAAQKGVEGNDKVIKGKEAEADATHQQQIARQDLANTYRETAEAQQKAAESVQVALDEQARAQSELAKTAKDANSAITQMAAMFADLAAPLQGPLHNAMESFKQQFMALKPVIQQGFSSAAEYVQPFTDALTGLMLGPVPGVVQALQNSQPAVDGFRDGMRTLGTDIGTMFANVSQGAVPFGQMWRDLGKQVGIFLDTWGSFVGRYAGPLQQIFSTLLQFINTVSGAFLTALGPVMPVLAMLVTSLSNALTPAITALAGPLGQFVAEFVQSLIPVINTAAPILLDLAKGFNAVLTWLGPTLPILAPLAAGFVVLAAALDLNPFVLIAGAIAGVAAGIGYLATQTHVFQDIWAKMPKGVQEFGAAVVNDTKNFVTQKNPQTGKTGAQSAALTISEDAKQFINMAKVPLSGALDELKRGWDGLSRVMSPVITQFKKDFGDGLAALGKQWNSTLKPAFEDLGQKLGPLWEQIKPILAGIGGVLAMAIGGFASWISSGIKPTVIIISTAIGMVIHFISDVVTMVTGILQLFHGVFQFVGSLVRVIAAFATGNMPALKNALHSVQQAIDNIKDGVEKFIAGWLHLDSIETYFRTLITGVKVLWTEFKDWLVKTALDIVTGVVHWFEWLYDKLVGHSIIPDLINDIIKWFESLPDKLIKLVEDLGSKIADAFTKLWDAVKVIASKAWDALKNDTGIGSFIDGIKSTFSGLLTDIGDIWDGIKKVFATPINAVIGFWNDDIVGKIPGLSKLTPIAGYASGGQPDGSPGYISGTGGSREDKHIVAVSNREYIVNAEATSRNRAVLDAMNFGGQRAIVPGFALGGTPAQHEAEVPGFSLGGIAFRHLRKAAGLRFADGGPTDGSTNPAIARALQWAAGYQGRPYNDQGWLDCSGFASGVYDSLLGRAPKREFTTMSDFEALGFVPGSGGIMEIGVTPLPGNYGHMAVTLAGHQLESGGVHDDIRVDGPAIGADDTQFQNRYYLPGKYFNPPYSGAGADGGKGSGGGFFGMIGSAFQAVVGGVRNGISDLFQKLTDPVLSAIPDPLLGGEKGFLGSFPKQMATKSRDDIANLIRGHESTNTIGGTIPTGDRLAMIDAALALTNTPPPGSKQQWEAGMNTLVGRESGWNTGAVNDWDSNAKAGNASKGLAQTTGSTFAAFAAPGHNNIFEGVDNLAASINYIKATYHGIDNVQQANANMPSKGYAAGTTNAKKGWSLVGELGPELVLFGGGEAVIPNNMLGDFGNNWDAATQLTGMGLKAQFAGLNFAQENFKQAVGDLGGSTEGGFLETALTQIPSYALAVDAYRKSGQLGKGAYQQLSNQIQGDLSKPPANPLDPGQEGVTTKPGTPPDGAAPQQNQNPLSQFLHPTEVHFHVSDVDEAIGKWKQHQREATLGFDPFGIFGSS